MENGQYAEVQFHGRFVKAIYITKEYPNWWRLLF